MLGELEHNVAAMHPEMQDGAARDAARRIQPEFAKTEHGVLDDLGPRVSPRK